MKIRKMIYQKNRKNELLHCGEYKNYNYYILNLGTHPTAYIEIPKGNKLYGKSYDELYDNGYKIEVHGGLTYSNNQLMGIKSEDWFIGWDYAHYGDYCGFEEDMPKSIRTYGKKWTTEEIIEECKNAIDQIIGFQFDSHQTEEEKKIPEKLTDILRVDDLVLPVNENMYKIWTQTIKNHNKINEICDYLKSKGE